MYLSLSIIYLPQWSFEVILKSLHAITHFKGNENKVSILAQCYLMEASCLVLTLIFFFGNNWKCYVACLSIIPRGPFPNSFHFLPILVYCIVKYFYFPRFFFCLFVWTTIFVCFPIFFKGFPVIICFSPPPVFLKRLMKFCYSLVISTISSNIHLAKFRWSRKILLYSRVL